MPGDDKAVTRTVAVVVLVLLAIVALRGYLPGAEPAPGPREPASSGSGSLIAVVAMVAVSFTVIAISIIAQARHRVAAQSAGEPPREYRSERDRPAVAAAADRGGRPAGLAVGACSADAVGIRPRRRRGAAARPRPRRRRRRPAEPNRLRRRRRRGIATCSATSRRPPSHCSSCRRPRPCSDAGAALRRQRTLSSPPHRGRVHPPVRISPGRPNSGWPRSGTAAAIRARRSSPATRRWNGNWRSRLAPSRRIRTHPRRCWPGPSSAMPCTPTARPELVDLFEEARFSPHVMNEGHRADAVAALRLVQRELQGVP